MNNAVQPTAGSREVAVHRALPRANDIRPEPIDTALPENAERIRVEPTEGRASAGHALAETVALFATGALLFAAVYWLAQRFVPFSIYEAVRVRKNAAVAVLVLAVAIGLGLILSASLEPAG